MADDSKGPSPTPKADDSKGPSPTPSRKRWYERLNPFPRDPEFDMSLVYGEGTLIHSNMKEIIPFLRKWRKNAMTLRFLQILLGFLATFFSLLTATILTVDTADGAANNFYAKIFSFIAAVSIGLLTAFDLNTKSNNMTDAWRQLTAIAIKYNKKLCFEIDVINAYIKGERTIGNVTFNQQQKQSEGNEPNGESGADELIKWVKLKEQGFVTEQEFVKMKDNVINRR